MDIEYSKISLYLELFDLLRDIGILPEYQNISIIVNDDYSTLLYFNANEILSYKKLRRLLFKKKYIPKKMPPRYQAQVFDSLKDLLKTDIKQKFALWSDDINYLTGRMIMTEDEKYKLGRLFYIGLEIYKSANLFEVGLIRFDALINEFLLTENPSSDEIEQVKQCYISNTNIIKDSVDYYNKKIRKIKRIRKKLDITNN